MIRCYRIPEIQKNFTEIENYGQLIDAVVKLQG